MKGKEILNKTRKDIIDFITYEVKMLYKKFGWDEPKDGEYTIPTSELSRKIRINVEVDNSYLDVEDRCYEDMEVTEIIVDENGVCLTTDDDDYSADEVSIEELADVADVLEFTYIKG